MEKRFILITSIITILFITLVSCFGSMMLQFLWAEGSSISVYANGADLSHIHSQYALLEEKDSERILASLNAEELIYPASMTKMMSAIVVIENTEDLNRIITIPYDIYPYLYEQNASVAGFYPGDEVRVIDLLYGILLPSGAECCLSLAYDLAQNEAGFVEMMNQKAKALNMNHTHFMNSTGLHDDEHVTTLEDLSILLRYALKNETFRMIFTTEEYRSQPTSHYPSGLLMKSTMFRSLDQNEEDHVQILGGKTGYTSEAGKCLASIAEVDGKEYILITAKAEGTSASPPTHVMDAQNIYDQLGIYKKYIERSYSNKKISLRH